MKKVDHIGIAVKDLEQVLPYYTETLGCPLMKIEEVEGQKVKVAFIDAGNIKLELLEPMSEDSPIHKFIEKKGEGIHHIAFGVDGIEERMAELRENGVKLLSDEPKPGAGGAMVAFLHPKSSNGVLYELCEKK
ncbi:methylmalonyl-CoA epimerase [Planococcus sp. CP5-4]|uniref:methylmalonyl-CoA epimerase n=1 Tax=Planococcus TaxID=1372 RepID=UPI00080EFF26|nr:MULTISPECIES: methylmalonyl-CoA epimerase [Planococcus]MDN5709725.1 methylmalonyl-CoA epimerase [Planococcus sp. (in: firmicutes)]ANU17086.1 methylmalonyl-CoA epimerase [Planococcus maritimus]MBU9672730.1 methylmalonyl-CoA epimerase [Planococcus sp. CP5-4_YE]MBV0908503.1 methylmalonyl-CoA epimerase [Planococcus sp. CP5-4_UN]MBW6063271.1 methylmalonyl-CoA epimerase [Planococcus sp. CP5-4]